VQRLDSFLGSDLTYEDFERQRAADFAVEPLPAEVVAGEHCTMLRALPRGQRAYAAVVLAVRPTAQSSSTAISRATRRHPTA